MEKLKYVHPVGTNALPMPTVVKKDAITEDGETRLGLLKNPFVVESDLPQGRFLGELFRNMPTPSLLDDFLSGLEQRHTANEDPKSRMIETFLGAAGAGKTFRAELTGRLIHEKGAVLIDCGGKNLRELLYETYVDSDSAKTLFKKIDDLLQEYNKTEDKSKVEPSLRSSVLYLKKGLGEAFSEENGCAGIDWWMAAQKGILEKKEAQEALDLVAKIHGLDRVDASALGLKTREGPLIRAWREGRPVILDEYNKSHEGSGGALQGVLQVFTGEKSKHTVSGDGINFTFDRKEKKPGFFVTVTGNMSSDGGSTHGLEQSVYTRLSPKFISDASPLDWEHRICQCLTGLPLSTLWRCRENDWKVMCQEAEEAGKPDPFAAFCRNVRMAGLTPEEKAAVPETQLALIDHYPQVMMAAEQLSRFYIEWSNSINPDILARGSSSSNSSDDFSDEIDDDYAKSVGLSLRKAIEHIQIAQQPRVDGADDEKKMFDPNVDFDAPIKMPRQKRFDPLEELGTNLMLTIADSVNNTTMKDDPNPANRKVFLRKHLFAVMEAEGIIPSSKSGARPGGIQTLETLLNIHIERPEEKYQEISGLICDELRERYSELKEQPDESIIPPGTFETTFQNVTSSQKPGEMLLPNISSLEEFADKPLEMFNVERSQSTIDPPDQDVISKSQFLIGLTFPGSEKILGEMFKASKKSSFDGGEQVSFLDFLATSKTKGNANKPKTPSTVTVNIVGTQDGNLISLYNKSTKQTLLIGNGDISPDLAQALQSRGISYLPKDSSAKELNDAFAHITGSEKSAVLSYMSEESGREFTSFASVVSAFSPTSMSRSIIFKQKGR